MSDSCQYNLNNKLAGTWQVLMGLRFGSLGASDAIKKDNAITAKVQIEDTILQLRGVEDSLRTELVQTASSVKQAQAQNAKTTLHHLLVRSRTKRMRLSQTITKRQNMEHQLDTLAMTELNNQVISSMQKTSVALRALGVTKAVEDADEVMMDIQDTHQDISTLQDVLGQSINMDSIDDDALADELNILLSDHQDQSIKMSIPPTTNTMKIESTETSCIQQDASAVQHDGEKDDETEKVKDDTLSIPESESNCIDLQLQATVDAN